MTAGYRDSTESTGEMFACSQKSHVAAGRTVVITVCCYLLPLDLVRSFSASSNLLDYKRFFLMAFGIDCWMNAGD